MQADVLKECLLMRLGKRTRKEVDVSSSGDEMFLLWNINGKPIR